MEPSRMSRPIPVPGEPSTSQAEDAYAYVELDDAALCGSAVLAEECALAIAYNGISHAVMMVSPSAIEDFVIGFSLSSAVVSGVEEIFDVRVTRSGDTLNAEVQISKVEAPSQWQNEFQAFTHEQLDLLPQINVVQL